MRISVAHVVNLVANGMSPQQIVVDLPDLDLVESGKPRPSAKRADAP